MSLKKIITNYTIKEFILFLLLSLFALSSIYLIINFMERIDNLLENKLPLRLLISFLSYNLPQIIFQMLPVAALMAVLLSLGIMAKNGEIIAFLASGISLYQVITPIIICCLILSALSILAQDKFLPFTAEQAQMRLLMILGKKNINKTKQKQIWVMGGQGRIFHLDIITPQDNIIYGLTMFQMDKDFNPQIRIDAQKAIYKKGMWHLFNGRIKKFSKNNGSIACFDEEIVKWKVTIDDFANRQKSTEQMGYTELKHYIKKLQKYGFDTKIQKTDFHFKISSSFSIIIFALLGIPFAVRLHRAVTFFGIGLSFGLSFVFWFILYLSISLAHIGALTPILGAWMGNIIFGSFAFYLLLKL